MLLKKRPARLISENAACNILHINPEDATTLACFPISWGIQGLMYVDTESIFMRFSIEDRKFSSELLESLS